MKKLNGYETAQAYFEQERLPVGGYVLKILDVKYQENSWGDVILLSFDIEEGEYKGFLPTITGRRHRRIKMEGYIQTPCSKGRWFEQDNWTMRRFKTVISAFEESNSGYHWNWDEQTLKGK